MVNSLIKLGLAGRDSFTSSQPWLRKVTGTLFCPHCHNVYSFVKRMDAVVDNNPRQTDLDLIAVNCGRVRLLSTHFIEVVGAPIVERTAFLGQLNDASGFVHDRYRTAIARNDPVIIRGPEKSNVGLCQECKRLLYWPIGDRYVLRADLPEEEFFFSDGNIFCTREFYEKRIKPAEFARLEVLNVPVLDHPKDGLPEKKSDLISGLELTHKLK